MDIVAVIFFGLVVGFLASVSTRSAVRRYIQWWVISLIPAIAVLSEGGGGLGFLWFGYCLAIGLVATGIGSVLGYCVRRFGPAWVSLPAGSATQQTEGYTGPRCVACRQPIAAELPLCPRCGWTQPR
jgi:hypothetical protein